MMSVVPPSPDEPRDPHRTDLPPIVVSTRRFDHQRGGDWPGSRGLVIDARRHSEDARVFSPSFPSVWVTDSIEVEMDDGGRWPADEFLAWIDAVRPHLIEATQRATEVKNQPINPDRR
jgi:hypothetical protein